MKEKFDKNKIKINISKLLVGTMIVGQLATLPITNVEAAKNLPSYKKEGYLDQAIRNVNLIVDNRGVEANDSTGYPFITKEGRVIVPVRYFANAIGADLLYDKKYPLMFTLKLGERKVSLWAFNNFSLANNITYTTPIYPYVSGGKLYCDIEPLAEGLNLLTVVDNSTIDITTENQFFNDPLVNTALKPYDDIRFVVQKHNDTGMSTRQEATWNFVKRAKDTRNKRIYKEKDYTSKDIDPLWKSFGPANGWKVVSGVYPYKVKDRDGVERTIVGTTGVNYAEKTEQEVIDRMVLNNYPKPKVAKYLRAVGQKNTLEVAYNHLHDIYPIGTTHTYVDIDDYVVPDGGGGGGVSIKIDNKGNVNPNPNPNPNTSNNTPPNAKGYGEKTIDTDVYLAGESKEGSGNPGNPGNTGSPGNPGNPGNTGNPGNPGNGQGNPGEGQGEGKNPEKSKEDKLKDLTDDTDENGWDPYRGSVGQKRFRRTYTIIQPLNSDQEKFSADKFLSKYKIFSGLMFPHAEFGVSTFSYYKESDKRWYTCYSITVSNIGGFLESDKNKEFENYKRDEDYGGGSKWWDRKNGNNSDNSSSSHSSHSSHKNSSSNSSGSSGSKNNWGGGNNYYSSHSNSSSSSSHRSSSSHSSSSSSSSSSSRGSSSGSSSSRSL